MDRKLRNKSHGDLPASVRLVKQIRSELRAELRSLEARLDSLDSKMESRFDQMLVVSHRTQVLMEEQRSENRIVLDGLKTVLDRQDRIERKLGLEPTN